MKYKKLEHPADLKISAFGKTKKELFLNIMYGMEKEMLPEIKNQESKIRKIKIKSPDQESLLIDFLSEVLYQSQINKETYRVAKFKKFSDKEIIAEIFGKEVRYFGKDIKGVTYHDLKIKQETSGSWRAAVVFDI